MVMNSHTHTHTHTHTGVWKRIERSTPEYQQQSHQLIELCYFFLCDVLYVSNVLEVSTIT